MLDTWFPVPELGARGPSGTSRLLAAEVLPTWPGWAWDYPTRAIFFEYSRTGREIERLCLAGQNSWSE